jgi:hypothetical protein
MKQPKAILPGKVLNSFSTCGNTLINPFITAKNRSATIGETNNISGQNVSAPSMNSKMTREGTIHFLDLDQLTTFLVEYTVT